MAGLTTGPTAEPPRNGPGTDCGTTSPSSRTPATTGTGGERLDTRHPPAP